MTAIAFLPLVARLVSGIPAAAPVPVPEIRYIVKVESRSWQPIALPDVEAMLEAKALATLAAGGNTRLAKSDFTGLKGGDYALLVNGRFIEEAEKFSVYLTFSAGTRQDLPSFHVSETESVGHRSGTEMQHTIEGETERAAQRLAALLGPRLASMRSQAPPPPLEADTLPWSWGAVEVPNPTGARGSVLTLMDPRKPDHERATALTEIAGQVFDQPVAREAVQLCALRDPSPSLRASCVDALAPVARTNLPTQRLLLQALRTEIDDNVQGALSKVATSFVGLSRKETIETWLELVASDTTTASGAGAIAELLGREGDVPNLDLAVARCLQQEALVYGKKQACAQWLLRNIPATRRAAVVWRYLEKVGVFEQGEMNTLNDVMENVVERGSGPIDQHLGDLFLSIAERPSAGLARLHALAVVRRYPKPTPAFIDRLLRVANEPLLTGEALRVIDETLERAPELKDYARAGIERLRAGGPLMRQHFRGDPNEEIERALKRL